MRSERCSAPVDSAQSTRVLADETPSQYVYTPSLMHGREATRVRAELDRATLWICFAYMP